MAAKPVKKPPETPDPRDAELKGLRTQLAARTDELATARAVAAAHDTNTDDDDVHAVAAPPVEAGQLVVHTTWDHYAAGPGGAETQTYGLLVDVDDDAGTGRVLYLGTVSGPVPLAELAPAAD